MKAVNYVIWFILIALYSISYFYNDPTLEKKIEVSVFECVMILFNIYRLLIDTKFNKKDNE